MLASLSSDLHRLSFLDTFFECATRTRETGRHNVGSAEHELDGALVDVHLGHHGGVLVEDSEGGEPGAILGLEEEDLVASDSEGEKSKVALSLDDKQGILFGDDFVDDVFESRELFEDRPSNASHD